MMKGTPHHTDSKLGANTESLGCLQWEHIDISESMDGKKGLHDCWMVIYLVSTCPFLKISTSFMYGSWV